MLVKVNLTDSAAQKEARLSEIEAELARSRATCERLSQVGRMVGWLCAPNNMMCVSMRSCYKNANYKFKQCFW